MAFCWYFTQEDIDNKTPSRNDGISKAVEIRYRKDGARFIMNASNTLKLRHDTLATGVVYFHRFFMMQSFKLFDRWVVAAACLLLAGKVEETPKKCKDILKVTSNLLNEQQMRGFGNNPKEELLTHERILLQTIKFDLQLEHPYAFLLKYAKALKGDKSKIEKLVQMAWTFVNDSFSTTLCLQWEPQAIAVAFIYLAGKLSKVDVQGLVQSKSRSWWRQFVDTLDIHDLETICHQVLDLYGESGSNSNQEEPEKEPTITTPTSEPSIPAPPPPAPGITTPSIQQQQPQVPLQQNQSILGPPPTNHVALPTTGTTQVGAPPTSVAQTQATLFNPMGLSFMANPLQALQNLRPATNQQPAYTNQYSTQNTGTTAVQQGTAYAQLTALGSPALGGTAGKSFLPSTPLGVRINQPQQLVGQTLTPQQLPRQQMVTQQLTPQQITAQNLIHQPLGTRPITPQQLSGQHLVTQHLAGQSLVQQPLGIPPQQQTMLSQNNIAIGTHSLPHAGTISPAIRNMGTGMGSQPLQQTGVAGGVAYSQLLPPTQKRLGTAPHMMQPLATPQLGGLAQTQTMLGCTASSIPTQRPPIMTQQHIPAGVGGAPLTAMNVGMNRPTPQLATPTRPPGLPPPRPYNVSGVGRGWGVR